MISQQNRYFDNFTAIFSPNPFKLEDFLTITLRFICKEDCIGIWKVIYVHDISNARKPIVIFQNSPDSSTKNITSGKEVVEQFQITDLNQLLVGPPSLIDNCGLLSICFKSNTCNENLEDFTVLFQQNYLVYVSKDNNGTFYRRILRS